MDRRNIILTIILLPLASAHEGSDALPDPLILLGIATLLTILALGFTIARNVEKLSATEKLVCFWLIALPVMLTSFYLVIHTLYDTKTSETNGPIHWHADYEIWVCGEKLDLVNPKFPKNKIGSPLLHEHNDDRIHVEGTVKNLETITLGRYFAVIDGALTPDLLSYPTTQKIITVQDNQTCPKSKNPATLKIYINGKRHTDPASYLIYPAALVPPGDCIIVQFDETDKEQSEKRCTSWQVKKATYENLDRPVITLGERTWK